MSVLGGATALLFAYVGAANFRRDPRDAPARWAVRQFGLWWLGLAGLTLQVAASTLLVAFGATDVRLHVALMAAGYVPLCVGLWGLLSYLVYIYAGTHRWQPLLATYHAALCAGLLLLLARTRPAGVAAHGWGIRTEYAHPLTGAPLLAVVLAILGPVILGAVAYGGLYRKAKGPAQRRRILTVSAALVLWFGLSAAAGAQVFQVDWWPLAARALALGGAMLLLRAFAPPRAAARDG